MKQYEVWLASLPTISAHSNVQNGVRPVIIMSNNIANEYSPALTVVPLTSKKKKLLPTHVELKLPMLKKTSTALCEQLITLDRKALLYRLDSIGNRSDRAAIQRAIKVQLNLLGDKKNKKENFL